MKVEITQKGAHGPKGEHKVGDTVTIDGDVIPGYLVGKCRPLGRVAVTNPASGSAPGTEDEELKGLRARYTELFEKKPGMQWDADKLREMIAEKEADTVGQGGGEGGGDGDA